MRDLDDLVSALRAEASDLPPTPMMPAVRARARRLHRRRVAAGGVAAALLVVAGLVVLRPSSKQQAAVRPEPSHFYDVIGRTWTLIQIDRAGQTWSPAPGSTSTIVFWSGGEAEEDDGENNMEWSFTQTADQLTWSRIWSTGVGKDPQSRRIDEAVAALLRGRTTWRLVGDRLTLVSASGDSLTYTASPLNAPVVGSVLVTLLVHYGKGSPLQGLDAVAGTVTIRTPLGVTVWHGQVTPDDPGDDLLQAGRYVVSAVIPAGRCSTATVHVTNGRSSGVALDCPDSRSSP